ncbi:REP-associated tyrosine transposase [Terrimonas pollutisoli]|uniref:REP-associated tyrosine transposase n=1 Tax=Terrimonas pollutisoli TaxID=3034147 RepID=UPI0023ED7C9B|nr:transposase [Terrimonas sp. H1YJ31]
MPAFITEYPQFFTATNLEWKKLLEPDKYKDIIISSFQFLVEDKRIKLYAFVIMPNHIHLIWQMEPLIHPQHVQRDFLKYTAQKIKHDLRQHHPAVLERFRVDAADREYQIWERNPLSIELRTDTVYRQKLDYIHWNPVRAGICGFPEEYKYSSALFYETGVDNWGFLSHHRD